MTKSDIVSVEPVPGACATTGPYAVDSTLFLEWKPASLITQLFFYDANAGYAYTTPPICNLSPLLSYTLYQYDLPEGDFKESTLFSALADMVTPSQIRAKATQVIPPNRPHPPHTRIIIIFFFFQTDIGDHIDRQQRDSGGFAVASGSGIRRDCK